MNLDEITYNSRLNWEVFNGFVTNLNELWDQSSNELWNLVHCRMECIRLCDFPSNKLEYQKDTINNYTYKK